MKFPAGSWDVVMWCLFYFYFFILILNRKFIIIKQIKMVRNTPQPLKNVYFQSSETGSEAVFVIGYGMGF